jgi:hypothetical protein
MAKWAIEMAGGGGAKKSKKTSHNSIVEASLYRNECFVPEIRDEFHALNVAGERETIWVARMKRSMTIFLGGEVFDWMARCCGP